MDSAQLNSEYETLAVLVSTSLKLSSVGCMCVAFLAAKWNAFPRRRKASPVTALDLAYAVCSVATCSLCVWQGLIVKRGMQSHLPLASLNYLQLSSICVLPVALVLAPCISFYTRWRQAGSSFALCGAHFLHLAAVVTDLLLATSAAERPQYALNDSFKVAVTDALLITTVMGCFLFSGCQDTPMTTGGDKQVQSTKEELGRSVFCRLLYTLVWRHVWNGTRTGRVAHADLPALDSSLRCHPQVNRLDSFQRKHTGDISAGRFTICLLRVLWQDWLSCIAVNCAYQANLIARIPLIELLLEAETLPAVSILTALFVASCAGEFLLGSVEAVFAYTQSIKVKSVCLGAIFTKMMRMSPCVLSRYPAGYFVSICGVDCTIVPMTATIATRVIVGLLFTPMVFYAIWGRIGTLPVLCCVAWQLFTFALLISAVKLQQIFWARILKWRDARIKKLTDILSSVRLVKFYAWEDAYAASVKRLRHREVQELFAANLTDGFVDSIFLSSTSVMIIIIFGTLVYFYPDKALSASLSFSCIYGLSILDPTNSNITYTLKMVTATVYGIQRIAKACTEKDWDRNDNKSDEDNLPEGSICLERCSFAWSSEPVFGTKSPDAALSDVSLRVHPGSLVGLVGSVGSGKSALLAALLGEMHTLSGRCIVKGSVACVPQTACIYNTSIRDNILFGKKLDLAFYQRVLSACDLLKDIASFPSGDLTEVGEKGTTLSGGQKQRVALARAAYSDSSVFLLDDTLSALDVHVASKVFQNVIGEHGILGNKTRLLVCNQSRYLQQMEKVILVADREVALFGCFDELAKDGRCPPSLHNCARGNDTIANDNNTIALLNEQESGAAHRVTQDETETSDIGGLDLSLSMARMCGPSIVVAIACLALRAAAVGTYLVWIKRWTDASSGGGSTSMWITGLAVICLSDVLFGCLGAFSLAVAFRNLCVRLHETMIRGVLGSPVDFFDATPRGRVLNRLTTELDSVDSRLCMGAKQLIQTLTVGVARLIVTGLLAPPAAILGGLCSAFFIAFIVATTKATNVTRRFDSAQVSRVIQHVTETRDSLSVVHSYGAEPHFCRHYYRIVDAAIESLVTLAGIFRTTRFLGSLCGFLVIMSSLAFTLFATGSDQGVTTSGSTLGLTLNSSMGISLLIMGSTSSVFFLAHMLVSFDRCLEYTRLSPEVDCDTTENRESQRKRASVVLVHVSVDADHVTRATWPTEGKIKFEDFSASYKPGVLPDVLVDVCFIVEPREKDPCLTRGPLRDVLDPTGSHSDEDVRRALDQAHLTDFVAGHPENIRLEVGDAGSNLSAGQRQLVCLARALLRRPRVLLLDEATSHMDGDTDRLVQSTLRDNFAHCTVITIAHRLDTVLDYDKILVMAAGRVIEFGHTNSLALDPRSEFRALLLAAGLSPGDAATKSPALRILSTRL